MRRLGGHPGGLEQSRCLRKQGERGVAGEHRRGVIERRGRGVDLERGGVECGHQRQKPLPEVAGGVDSEVRPSNSEALSGPARAWSG